MQLPQARTARMRLLPAAAAALLLALARFAAAQTMLPFGTTDCMKPQLSAVDAYPLNTASFRITRTPINAVSSSSVASVTAAAAVAPGDAAFLPLVEATSVYDNSASILNTNSPYWMAQGRSARPPNKTEQVPLNQALAAAAQVSSALTASVASVRAAAVGGGVTAAAAVSPVTVTVNGLFSITYYGTYKIVTNLITAEVYVLYQCGTPNPASSGVSLPAGARVFQIPLRSVAVPDTTALAFMANLKLQDRVVAAPSFCTEACGQFVARTCSFKSDPDWNNGGKLPATVRAASVAVLNVAPDKSDPLAITVSSAATAPILRPQWLKFVGTFFNRDGIASGNADTQARNYDRKRLRARSAVNGPRPNVLWMSAMDRFKDWGYPTEGVQYIISGAQYKKNYITDAGGIFLSNAYLLTAYPQVAEVELFSKPGAYQDVAIVNDKNPAVAKQALLNIMRKADIIFDETYFIKPVNAPNLAKLQQRYGLSDAEVASIPAYKNKQVYTVGKRLSADSMGTDWYEGANVETDRVLDDFIRAITPAIAEANKPFKWLHRLDGVEIINSISPTSCTSVRQCTNRRPASTCANAYFSCSDGTLVYGYRFYHCNPATCTVPKCNCCSAGVSAACKAVCASANKLNCPR